MRVVVAVALALTCSLASAAPPGMTPPVEEEPPAPAAPPPRRVESYRGQTLLADGLAAGLVLVALGTADNERGEAIAKVGIATYAFGAPVIHLTKDRSARALASVTLRIGLPIAGALLGNAIDDGYTCEYDVCYAESPSDTMVLGVVAGLIGASAIDAVYLAKGDPAPKQEPTWTPTARATQGGVALGVAGRF